MENNNKSLSARIRRRNKQGFNGNGTPDWSKVTPFGDYKDSEQNGKASMYAIEERRKNKLGFKRIARDFSLHKRALTKKFADNHQKATK